MFAIAVAIWLAVVAAGFVAARWRPLARRMEAIGVGRLYLLGLAAAGAAGVVQLIVPAAPDHAAPGAFSVDRAQIHIEAIAGRPRPIGSDANKEVRAYLVEHLLDLGLEPVLQEASVLDWYGDGATSVPIVNVLARIRGTDPTGAVALVAHYDTVPTTPGANDNASGVAVALDVARTLTVGDRPRNDVIVLFTDGEEPAPKFGATVFVERHEWFADIRFVVNLEAIGTGGPSWLTEIHGPQSWVLDRYGEASRPAAYSFLTEITDRIGGSNTDFAAFRDAGVPGMEFVYGRGSSVYHAPADTPDSVSRAALHRHGTNAAELVRHVAGSDLSRPAGGDAVFFTIGSGRMFRHPAVWALPVAVLAVGALFDAARRRGTLAVIVPSAGRVLLRLVAATVVVTALWLVVADRRPTMGMVESTTHLFALGVLTATLVVVRFPRRRLSNGRLQPDGVLLVFAVLALVCAVLAPGTSYLFVYPPLAGVLALPFDVGSGDGRPRLGSAVLAVGGWFLLSLPAVDVFFQFAQPRPWNTDSQILPTIAASVLLIGLGAALADSCRVSSTDGIGPPRDAPRLEPGPPARRGRPAQPSPTHESPVHPSSS